MTQQPNLYEMCVRWNQESTDPLSAPNYLAILQQVLAHATLRFAEYAPFALGEKPFLERLYEWIHQVPTQRSQQAMLELLRWIMFLDEREMTSLYRDVFRRIIVPWITPTASIECQLAPDYDQQLLTRLQSFDFYSITESFQHKVFENSNSLSGLRKPVVLGEESSLVPGLVDRSQNASGVIVLEDIVGTGSQAERILEKVVETLGPNKPILFAPLLLLQAALAPNSALSKLAGVSIQPTTIIPSRMCLTEVPHSQEPALFKRVRSIIKATKGRVLQRLSDTDDPPIDAFGFGGVGALVVTHQNTPNNTLPFIHHKAPRWEPLFRRNHHAYLVRQ